MAEQFRVVFKLILILVVSSRVLDHSPTTEVCCGVNAFWGIYPIFNPPTVVRKTGDQLRWVKKLTPLGLIKICGGEMSFFTPENFSLVKSSWPFIFLLHILVFSWCHDIGWFPCLNHSHCSISSSHHVFWQWFRSNPFFGWWQFNQLWKECQQLGIGTQTLRTWQQH